MTAQSAFVSLKAAAITLSLSASTLAFSSTRPLPAYRSKATSAASLSLRDHETSWSPHFRRRFHRALIHCEHNVARNPTELALFKDLFRKLTSDEGKQAEPLDPEAKSKQIEGDDNSKESDRAGRAPFFADPSALTAKADVASEEKKPLALQSEAEVGDDKRGPEATDHSAGTSTAKEGTLARDPVAGPATATTKEAAAVSGETSKRGTTKVLDKGSSSVSGSREDALSRAKAMKREAARVRMEAERMEAVLTLEKITLLEKKLRDVKNDSEKKKEVQDQIAILRRKLEGPTTNGKQQSSVLPSTVVTKKNGVSTSDGNLSSGGDAFISLNEKITGQQQLTPDELKERTESFLRSPKFLRQLTAKAAGFEDDSNATAVVLKMYQDEQEFLHREQNERENRGISANPFGKELSSDEGGLFGGLLTDDFDKSRVDALVESLYPKSTRRDGEAPSEAEVQMFVKDVLTASTFNPSGKPEKVPGGFVVKGSNRMEDGDSMVAAIDDNLAKSRVAEKLQFFYVNDPTPVTEDQIMSGDRDPVIFVTGPDVTTDTNRLFRVLISSVAVASIAFYAIFPFFLNEGINARVDEALSLGTTGDLDWLTDMTNPLFFSFCFIQFGHDIAHMIVATSNQFKISFPTLVPSPVLGLSSSITYLKSSPKNRQALFDFAIAGPLTGMLLSILALYIGLQLTISMDGASYDNLPALPAAFLQASTLVAGIAESVMGSGFMQGSDPINTVVKLHPLAIAGYGGLIVNALNLTPFGRTDGGRVALALLGRSGTQLAGLVTSVTLLASGFAASDAFLFYFLFITFFQGELEIPIRNEVDEVDFARILVATVAGVLVLLTLIPVF